jgi:excisionase family DNA binding protein
MQSNLSHGSQESPSANCLLTVPDVAGYLQLAEQTIYRMVCEKRIPHIHVGRTVRFRKNELDEWMTKSAALRRRSIS